MSLETFRSNFGGYVLAGISVLVAYSVVDAVAPAFSTPIALITLLGIVLFYFRRKEVQKN